MELSDSLRNLMTGLGTGGDKATYARFRNRCDLSKFELEAMYTSSWLAKTIIDAPADDMTRAWRIWRAGPRKSALLAAEEKRLRVKHVVNRALKLADLYGGSVIYIGTGDADPSEPLDVESIGRGGVLYLHVLSRWEVQVIELDRDPLSPWFGQPRMYELSSRQSNATRYAPSGTPTLGLTAQIHPSRMIRFLGHQRLEMSNSTDGWGTSKLQPVYEAVRDAESTSGNIATLVNEAKIDVIGIKNLTQNANVPEYREKLAARFSLMRMTKSNQSIVVRDIEEVWDQKQYSFGGLVEIDRMFLERVTAGANMPMTRFLGDTPAGLNANGDSSIRHWYDTILARLNGEVQPVMDHLDECIIRSALGNRPANVANEFVSLWQMTESEQTALALQKAQASEIYGVLGITAPSAMRAAIVSQLIADGTYPGLADAIATAANEPAAPLIAKADAVEKPGARATVAKD